jgi:hypothetical protein
VNDNVLHTGHLLATRDDAVIKTKEDLVTSGVFGGPMSNQVNYISRRIGREMQHQSDRDFPRMTFTRGITKRSKINASEEQGVMLLFLIILASTFACVDHKDSLLSQLGDDRLGSFIWIFENLLGFEEVLKGTRTDGIAPKDIAPLKWLVGKTIGALERISTVNSGDGFNTIKIHNYLVHMFDSEVKQFGCPSNVSGGPGESQFKENFKLHASTSQMREHCFDEQLYNRRYYYSVVQRYAQIITRVRSGVLEKWLKNKK